MNRDTLIIKAHKQSVISKEEPPDEKNGSGIPVAGNARTTTPAFMSDCTRMIIVQPKASRLLKRSLTENEMRKPRHANAKRTAK